MEDDPIKVNSPSPTPIPANLKSNNKEETAMPRRSTLALELDAAKITTSARATRNPSEGVPFNLERADNPQVQAPAPQPLCAGAKRKFGGEENDGLRILKQTDKQSKETVATGKPRPVHDLQNRRSVKDLPSGRREAGDRAAAAGVPMLNPRKALAAKSTNDSPLKASKPVGTDDSKPFKKPNGVGSDEAKQPSNPAADKPNSGPPKKTLPVVQIMSSQAAPSAPTPITTIPEPETPVPETELTAPNTPDHHAAPVSRDTPPPGGMGEAARPSRRARPAISYAEPNLRDKMRRPTKELFDAVAGEGKFKGRSSMAPPDTAQKDDTTSSAIRPPSSSKGKESLRAEDGTSAADMAVAKEASRRANALSPTPGAARDMGQKETEKEDLPSSITTQRRKRGSSMGLSSMDGLVARTTSAAPISLVDKPKETIQASHDGDVYDFESSSPVSGEKTINVRPPGRQSRASASYRENDSGSLTSDAAPGIKPGGRGKRASMAAALTKLSMLELEDAEESSLEGEPVVKDRISRRRSMML